MAWMSRPPTAFLPVDASAASEANPFRLEHHALQEPGVSVQRDAAPDIHHPPPGHVRSFGQAAEHVTDAPCGAGGAEECGYVSVRNDPTGGNATYQALYFRREGDAVGTSSTRALAPAWRLTRHALRGRRAPSRESSAGTRLAASGPRTLSISPWPTR